jgi:hypothetical protein
MVMDTLEWLFYKLEYLPTNDPIEPFQWHKIPTNERCS